MQKLEINNFGPIEHCSAEVSDFMVFIGPQSSGKSTVAKLVFFFLNLRDEYVNFILDNAEAGKNRIDTRDFYKLLRKRFVEFWGPTPQKSDLYIKYEYSDNTWAEIKLDDAKHKYVNIFLSPNILDALKLNFSETSESLIS